MAIITNTVIIILIVAFAVIVMLAILSMVLIRRRRNRNRVSNTKMRSLTLVPRVSVKHNRSMSEFSFREKNRVIGRNGGSLTRSHSIRKSDHSRFSFPSNTPETLMTSEELEQRGSQQKKGESRRFSMSVTVPVELVKPITRTYQLKNESHQFTYTSNFTDEPLLSTLTTTNEMTNV